MRLALLRVGPTWALPSRYAATAPARAFTISLPRSAEGDTGSIRSGGSRQADTWSRREKAAEDMYIREREKQILKLLKEKIAEQEAKLARDRAILNAMEDQYGHQSEERTSV